MTYEEFKQLAEHPQHGDILCHLQARSFRNGRAGGEEALAFIRNIR